MDQNFATGQYNWYRVRLSTSMWKIASHSVEELIFILTIFWRISADFPKFLSQSRANCFTRLLWIKGKCHLIFMIGLLTDWAAKNVCSFVASRWQITVWDNALEDIAKLFEYRLICGLIWIVYINIENRKYPALYKSGIFHHLQIFNPCVMSTNNPI